MMTMVKGVMEKIVVMMVMTAEGVLTPKGQVPGPRCSAHPVGRGKDQGHRYLVPGPGAMMTMMTMVPTM